MLWKYIAPPPLRFLDSFGEPFYPLAALWWGKNSIKGDLATHVYYSLYLLKR